ncbi:MAG: ROK family protein [Bacteroidales bacterium]|nr:ROK family protein [Bacteroidales bacterium]
MSESKFTIPEITEITGLSTTTVAKCVARMKEEKLLDEIALEESGGRGRRAIVYGVGKASSYFLGVDVHEGDLGIAIMDFTGHIVHEEHFQDYVFENSNTNLENVISTIESFIAKADANIRPQIARANFNLSGRVDSKEGTSASVFNFEETQATPLAEILSERLGIPVSIENDTKAMAFAEYLTNDQNWQNVLYANVSWGLGMGIILGGELYSGTNGFSGELGHVPFYDNNILCHCGKKGCIETEVSGSAIHRKLVERIRNGESSVLTNKVRRGDKVTVADIVRAADDDDPLCIDLISHTGMELGKHMAAMINIFNPEAIIIGGSVAQAASYNFQQYVSLAIRQNSLKLVSRNVKVLTSALGDEAGVLGACMIARERMMHNR